MKLTKREEKIVDYLRKNGRSLVKDIVVSFQNPSHYNTISTIYWLVYNLVTNII